MDENEAHAEWLAELITEYLIMQLKSGRTHVMESEVWQMLGQPFPADQEDRKFVLKEYHDNVVEFKRRLN